MTAIRRVAPDVGWLPVSFANVYFLGRPGDRWIVVDTGWPGRADQILSAAAARFGAGSTPGAIVLTHGHFDHAGSAMELAERWDVPIYAHALEIPYLNGQSAYPPPDPTIGGAMAFLSRFIPSGPHNFGARLRELSPNEVPGAPEWEWIPTPGHAPGHISLFRSSDRTLVAGDAFATMNMDSWTGLVSGRRVLAPGGAPFNCDWNASLASLQRLTSLRPHVAACGHGIPMSGRDLPVRLERFANRFRAPRRGRYVRQPARTDEHGLVALPPAPFDPVPFATAASLVLAGLALGAGYLDNNQRRR